MTQEKGIFLESLVKVVAVSSGNLAVLVDSFNTPSMVLAEPGAASVPKVEAKESPLDQFCCMVLNTIHG